MTEASEIYDVRRTQPAIARFEDERRNMNQGMQSLKAGKGKEMCLP